MYEGMARGVAVVSRRLGEVVGAVNGRVCEGVRVLELLMEALEEEMELCMKEWQEEL